MGRVRQLLSIEVQDMQIPFSGGFNVSQGFGDNPQNYAQFGLQGHEGLDFLPKDADKRVYAVESGVVMEEMDDPVKGKAYGIHVVIFVPTNRRLWTYAHLETNFVSKGERVVRGQPIGVMGSTGNTSGAHLHLGLRMADGNGKPLNTSNGYFGICGPGGCGDAVDGVGAVGD
jgi:murein DD-endopeptidase MepM/ murein hydrolase activator NlpD